MTTRVSARPFVGQDFPTVEGARLADVLLADHAHHWADLSVDLRELSASLLISAFFNSFLLRVYEANPKLLDVARKTKWELLFYFQRENIERWMAEFSPAPQPPKHAPPRAS